MEKELNYNENYVVTEKTGDLDKVGEHIVVESLNNISNLDGSQSSLESVEGDYIMIATHTEDSTTIKIYELHENEYGVKFYEHIPEEEIASKGIEFEITEETTKNIMSDVIPRGELLIKEPEGLKTITTSLEDDILSTEKKSYEKAENVEDIKYREYRVVYTGISSETGSPKELCKNLTEAKQLLQQNSIKNFEDFLEN